MLLVPRRVFEKACEQTLAGVQAATVNLATGKFTVTLRQAANVNTMLPLKRQYAKAGYQSFWRKKLREPAIRKEKTQFKSYGKLILVARHCN